MVTHAGTQVRLRPLCPAPERRYALIEQSVAQEFIGPVRGRSPHGRSSRKHVHVRLPDTPVRYFGIPGALALRRLDPRARLAAHRVRPGCLVGLRCHPLRAGLFRPAPHGHSLPIDFLALRWFHSCLRHHAPDGSDHLLVASLPACRSDQDVHGDHFVGYGRRSDSGCAQDAGDAQPRGAGARDRRAQRSGHCSAASEYEAGAPG